jgi:hypothetical protein
MLKTTLAMFLLLAGTMFAWSQEPSPSAGVTAQSQESKAATDNKPAQANRSNAEMAPIIVNVLPAPKSDREVDEERQERKDKAELDRRLVELTSDLAFFTAALFAATAALVIATIALAYYAFRQSRDMKESLVLARKSADAADLSARASIALQLPIIQIKPDQFGFGAVVVEGEDGKTKEYAVIGRLIFSNLGPTKAFPIEIRCGWSFGVLPDTPTYTFTKEFQLGYIFEPDPKVTPAMNINTFPFMAEPGLHDRIRNEDENLWFYCCLIYADFMQNRHEVAFCWQRVEGFGAGRFSPDPTSAYNRKT